MAEGPGRRSDPADSAPVDFDLLERMGRRLGASDRFQSVAFRPAYAPASLAVEYDGGYFPASVERATVHARWYENDDFGFHYAETHADGDRWECRWDRHPNGHNAREHFHPPPDAATPGRDASYPSDWRDVVARVLHRLDERIRGLWDGSREWRSGPAG